MILSANVVFDEKKTVKVTLVGMWKRIDVDRAYKAILMEMPRHILKIKEQDLKIRKLKELKEKKDGGSN